MKILKDFSRMEIKQIAEEYANEPVSQSYFTKKYNISRSTFYDILNKAVIEHIVSYDTVINMKNRAILNVENKFEKTIGTSKILLHYGRIISKRDSFIFSKNKRVKILRDFANRDPKISKTKFCEINFIDTKLLDKMIIQAIAYNEISEKTYKKIKYNSISNSKPDNRNSTLVLFSVLEELKNRPLPKSQININVLYIDICRKVKAASSN